MGNKDNARESILGKDFISKFGEDFTVVAYNNSEDVIIRFKDGVTVSTYAVRIREGNVPNPNRITTCGRGYSGEGSYALSENGVKTTAYLKWQSMLARVYGRTTKATNCYTGCSVAPVWFNFQNFAKWFEDELLKAELYTGKLILDKDLLVLNNTEYSPNNCVLLPYEVNIALQLIEDIYVDKRDQSFTALLTTTRLKRKEDKPTTSRWLGDFTTKKEAINKYSIEKDKYVRFLCEEFSTYLSEDAKKALKNFNTKERLQLKGIE